MAVESSTQSDDQDASSSLGEQELDVLRFVTDHAPVTARVVAEDWGQPHDLAKTTVQTVMERLRGKGYLIRTKRYGSFEYSPALSKSALLHQLVDDFVKRALGGSFTPLVQYLAEKQGLTPSEIVLLEAVVAETEAGEARSSTEPVHEGKSQNES